MNISIRSVGLFLRLSRPVFLLGGFLLYGLGAAILIHLDFPVDPELYVLGQLEVTFIQLMTHYLNEYFDAAADQSNETRTSFTGGSGALGPGGLPRRIALYAAAFSLAIVTTIAILLQADGSVPALAWMILIFIFLGAFLYNIPPVQLITSGYGEITTSVLVAGLLPIFAFVLQTGEFHRLLIMSSTPLIALHFSMMIVFELPDYANDLKFNKQTLLVRIGWSTAMRLHDVAILFAAGSVLAAFLFGMPQRVVLGMIIVLPLAVAQVWQISRLRRGFKPRWRTITFSGLALFALAAYLQIIGFVVK